MKVKEIIKVKDNQVISIEENKTIPEAVTLMNQNKIGALIVVSGKGNLAGIMTERDILQELDKRCSLIKKIKVKEIMTRNVITAMPEDRVDQLMGVMIGNKIRHLPVVEGDNILGVVSLGDLVVAQLQAAESKAKYLEEYIGRG